MGDPNAEITDLTNEIAVVIEQNPGTMVTLEEKMANLGFTRQRFQLVDGRRGRFEVDLSDDIEKESKIIEKCDFKNNHCVMVFLDILDRIPAKEAHVPRFYAEYFRYLRKTLRMGADFDTSVQPYKNKVPLFYGLLWFCIKRGLNASLLRNPENIYMFVCACNAVHAELVPQKNDGFSVEQHAGFFKLAGFFKNPKDDHPEHECDAKMLQQFGITPKFISKLRELSENTKIKQDIAVFYGLMYDYFKPTAFPLLDQQEE